MTADNASFPRVRGAFVLIALVIVGMGLPAYLIWAVPRLEIRRNRIVSEAPSEPEGRVGLWAEYGGPQIHNALLKARFSSAYPWFITHVVLADDGGDPHLFGIDFSDLPPAVVGHEGMTVTVDLEAPEELGRGHLVGAKVQGIPHFEPGEEPADPRDLARERLTRYLRRDAGRGLSKDIPGAYVAVRIGGLPDVPPADAPADDPADD